jgi:nucleoside phosphorylase
VDRADVLIVTALREEFEAAKEVLPHWEERDSGGSAPYLWGESAGGWSVALARPTAASGRSAGPITTTLTDLLRPSCLAMCGVCAGNPESTALGDVVVAEIVYEWDEGKHSPDGFAGDHRPIGLDPRWVRAAQDFEPSDLPSYGDATDEDARWWLLERLLLGQDARRHPARDRYFPPGTWLARLDRWTDDGLIARSDDGGVMLTSDGKRLVQRHLYDDVGGPSRMPFGVVVAPMASGSAVIADDTIWPRLARMGMRKIAAVEMEAATIATVAREREIPRWLVAKGVMDHADGLKDDRFKQFAARASAEVLFALLDKLIPSLDRDAPPPPAGSSVHISGNGNIFHGPIAGRDIR